MLAKYGITDVNSIRHFLAQVSMETNYSGYGTALSEKYSGYPDEYFEKKYGYDTKKGKELGNKYLGDAALFRGTGYIHLTGRYNYEKFYEYMKKNGINDPTIVSKGYERIKEAYAWEAAGYYWSVLTRANEVASNPNVHPDRLTDIVNFGTDTYGERANIYYNDVMPVIR